MDENKDLEAAPLLGPSVTQNKRDLYTVSGSATSSTEFREASISTREVGCYPNIPRQMDSDSDGEYNRSRRYLPNDATDPFVYLGFCCAILAGLCFTSSNVMVKYIPEVNSWQLLLVRCLAQLATMIPIMLLGKHNIFGTPDFATRWRLAAQGVLGGFLLLGIFVAVARMPLGDCTAIFFSSPAFTMVLSCIILKDHCGVWRCLVAITLLVGVMILSRPPALFPSIPVPPAPANHSDHIPDVNYHRTEHGQVDSDEGGYDLVGVLAALAVPTLSAWIVIITRQAKHVHYSVLVFWFGVGGLVVSMIGMVARDGDHFFQHWNIKEWMLSFMVALVGILGSIAMTKAVCWVTPSKVMVVRSFEVVAAYILQVTVFNVPTHWSDLAGTICVISAVIAMGLEDYLMEKLNWRFL